MYNYYMKFKSEEHMLFAREIAELYRIYSTSGKPHSSLIRAILSDYIYETFQEYNPMYYITKSGPVEVFPAAIYQEAINRFVNKQENNIYASLSGTKYKFN